MIHYIRIFTLITFLNMINCKLNLLNTFFESKNPTTLPHHSAKSIINEKDVPTKKIYT